MLLLVQPVNLVVTQNFSFLLPVTEVEAKRQNLMDVTKNTSYGEQKNEKLKKIFEKSFRKKSLMCVFFPCASFIFTPSVQSDSVSVWKQAELSLVDKRWTRARLPYKESNTSNPTFSLCIAFLTFHLCAILTEFKETTQTICVSHPHAAHTWTLTPPHSKSSHSRTQMLTYAGI